MRLRRFCGSTAEEALALVREELGEEAMVLGTTAAPGGGVEITAAVDADRVMAELEPRPVPAGGDIPARWIGRELKALGARLARLEGALVAPGARPEGISGELGRLADRLQLLGLSATRTRAVVEAATARIERGEPAPQALVSGLAAGLSLRGPRERRIRLFVGPTGSGKTTTIAKLASHDVVERGRRPALLAGDGQRVGAREQLDAYGRLLGVPVVPFAGPEGLRRALEEVGAREPIYVDTGGLSADPATTAAVAELLGDASAALGVTAVLSATSSLGSLERAWAQLGALAPEECVVTRIDESGEPAQACSWLAEVGCPVVWLGTGPRVPDDICEASAESLAQWLLERAGGGSNEA